LISFRGQGGNDMKKERIDQLTEFYRNTLLEDIVPFWMKYSLDKMHGGYIHCLDRNGTPLNTDKAVWIQCRETWLFSKLYNSMDKRPEWLDAAKLGYDFINKYCIDTDGRLFFQMTREGRPLRKRRYWFAETFAIIAFAEYYLATGDEEALEKAKKLYKMIVDFFKNPGSLPAKYYTETRILKSHAEPMILIATTQVLREIDNEPLYKDIIDLCMKDIFENFMKADLKALLESVGPNGEVLDNPQGRCINPGHSIETSWFLMQEGLFREDNGIIKKALDILDWSLERGWDKIYGGILYLVDVDGKPPEQLEWDMKLWWPHTEALYALLLASHITSDCKYEEWYEKVHQWTYTHFPDPEYGEWYGYLHRDGTVSLPVKGSAWKGPFHLPRYLMYGIRLLEKMQADKQ
jgi:N-acylglucosamine 2-epimerase